MAAAIPLNTYKLHQLVLINNMPASLVTMSIANGTHISAPNRHIWVVTGPAGCGKTTVAEHLSRKLDVPYVEGDKHHPESNIDKMRNGEPLTDTDRWDWLTILRQESMHRINEGATGVVVACSALKRKYRDVIRVAAYHNRSLFVHFIFLQAPADLLIERVTQRKNHFLGAEMVKSQLESIEMPQADETDVVTVDASRPADRVMEDALARAISGLDVRPSFREYV